MVTALDSLSPLSTFAPVTCVSSALRGVAHVARLVMGERDHSGMTERNAALEKLPRDFATTLALQLRREMRAEPDVVDDAVQDAFVKLMKQSEWPSAPERWIATVARNRLRDILRQGRTKRKMIASDEIVSQIPNPDPNDAEQDEWRGALRERLLTALAQLDERTRDMLVLKYVHGLQYPELAATLNIETSSVGTTLNRARKKLRSLLGPTFGGSDR